MLECLATLHQFTDTMWTEDGIIRGRHGNRWANLHPITLLPAPDGWFLISHHAKFLGSVHEDDRPRGPLGQRSPLVGGRKPGPRRR